MAYGDIGAPVNTREYDTADIHHPSMVHVSGDIFAIAYEDENGDGMVISIEITDAGVIGANIIQSLKFDEADGHRVSIVHVEGDIFAIAYRGPSCEGVICTVDIDGNGVIGDAVEDSITFEADGCYEPSLILVPGSTRVLAIVCRGDANQGIINTVSVTVGGTISAIQMKKAWATNVNNPQIVHVSNDIFAIVYRDNVFDGHVCTVDINTSGEIEASVEGTLEFDTGQGTDPAICHVLGNIYAIAYRGPGDLGFVCTVQITAAGAVTAAGGLNDLLEFDDVRCLRPDIIHLGGGICAIAYEGYLCDGYVETVEIDSDGQIAHLKNLEIDEDHSVEPSIVHVEGDQYAVAYRGPGSDGFVSTPTISTPPVGFPRHLMMMGVG